jgi:REP element-mobilizing transposase RayT
MSELRFVHLGGRGVRKGPLFETREDYLKFLTILEEVCGDMGIVVLAYCLMTTHYHLLLILPKKLQATFLKRLNFAYARDFNLRHGYCGHVFEARCWAFERGGLGLAAFVMSYIHLNPVRPGMVDLPEAYEWSSYRATIGLATRPAFLNPDPLLRWFSKDLDRAQTEYRKYVEYFCPDLQEVWNLARLFEHQNEGKLNLKRLLPTVELLAMTAIRLGKVDAEDLMRRHGLKPADLLVYGLTKFAKIHKGVFSFVLSFHRRTIARRLDVLQKFLASHPEVRKELDRAVETGLGVSKVPKYVEHKMAQG